MAYGQLAMSSDDQDRRQKQRDEAAKRRHLKMVLMRYMKENELNQSELARKCGLKRAVISTYMRETTSPTALTLRKMARGMGLTPAQLEPGASDIYYVPEAEGHAHREPDMAGRERITIDMLVSEETADKIFALLRADRNARKGGGR